MPDAEPQTDGPARISKFDRPPPPHDWRWWVGGLGKVLIATGLLMFGFVAYQLWGTGIETARAQNSLENQFEELLADSSSTDGTTSTGSATETEPDESGSDGGSADAGPVEEGDPVARLEIPAIGSDHIVVAGVSKSDLKKGPGHYPETPLPGQLGNAAIAGHRTTYGQPFHDIDKLANGDEIVTTTLAGRFVYRVTGTQIVSPSDYQVVATTDPTIATLTLTSCHPKWTARERIVVTAELDAEASSASVGEPLINYGRPIDDESPTDDNPTATVAGPPGTAVDADDADGDDGADPIDEGIADAFADGWFSDPGANGQVGLWGLLLAAIGVGSYLISRRAKRDWVGLLVGIVPFIVALYFFFQNVNRLLPPNL